MVYWLKIDGCLFGGFFDRDVLHKHLVGENWVQVTPGSDIYYLRVNGVMTGAGEVVETLPIRPISELPKL